MLPPPEIVDFDLPSYATGGGLFYFLSHLIGPALLLDTANHAISKLT